MSGFSDRLVSSSAKNLVLVVDIAGVPIDFTSQVISTPEDAALDGRGLLVSVDESVTTLDRQERRQVGGGATIVVQDRGDVIRKLVAQRSFRVTFVRLLTTRTATTIGVNSTLGLPSAGVVYIGGESVKYTGKTSNTITGCSRGYRGSPAQIHQGDTDQGAGVFLVPPSWIGRRVNLVGVFKSEDDPPGTAGYDTDTVQALGTFRLEESPRDVGNGRWEFRCSHLSDELAKRKLGTGLDEINLDAGNILAATMNGTVETLSFAAPFGTARMLTQGTTKTHVMLTVKPDPVIPGIGGVSIHEVVATTTGLVDTIEVKAESRTGPTGYRNYITMREILAVVHDLPPLRVEKVKHLAILEGAHTVSTLVLRALTSRIGDGANGTNDDLGGVVATALGGPGFSFGAGMLEAEIDTASMSAATRSLPSSWSWVIDEELSVTDLLRDYCRDSNTAAIFAADGRLTFAPMVEQRSSAVATIEARDVKGRVTATVDDAAVFSRVRIECNYDPIDGEHEGQIDLIDEEIAKTYAPAEGSLDVSSRSIVVSPVDVGGEGSLVRGSVSAQEVQNTFRRTMLDSRGGSLLLSFRASAKHLHLQLGDLVTLSMPTVSDFRGGDLATAKGRVIERGPDWKTLDIDLVVLVEEVLSHFAASFVLSAAAGSGTSWILTVNPTDFGASTEASTALGIRIGDEYKIYDPSVNIVLNSCTVIGVSGTSVTVTTKAPATMTAGLVLLLIRPGVGAAADGFAGTDYAYFGLNAVTNSISRWR